MKEKEIRMYTEEVSAISLCFKGINASYTLLNLAIS